VCVCDILGGKRVPPVEKVFFALLARRAVKVDLEPRKERLFQNGGAQSLNGGGDEGASVKNLLAAAGANSSYGLTFQLL
jgi:hypothetical protein